MTYDKDLATSAIRNAVNAVEPELGRIYPEKPEGGAAELYNSIKYSLLSGGKRIRATLVIETCRMLGGKVEAALPFACAVEMIHTYSLIHDDLPCMDDDDMGEASPPITRCLARHSLHWQATDFLPMRFRSAP
jgi:geranylgeranyl diphosphate synthase type II